MPKVVKTAAEILGTDKVPPAPAAKPSPAGEVVETPVVKIADPVVPEPLIPPAGFETPAPDVPEEAPAALVPPTLVVPPSPPEPTAPAVVEKPVVASRPSPAAPVIHDPEPAVAASLEPAAPAVVSSEPKKWRFIKNVHPGEIITFADGEKFKFPTVVFSTTDAVLAEKILAVATRHNIVQ